MDSKEIKPGFYWCEWNHGPIQKVVGYYVEDRLYFSAWGGHPGGWWAEYIAKRAKRLIPIPDKPPKQGVSAKEDTMSHTPKWLVVYSGSKFAQDAANKICGLLQKRRIDFEKCSVFEISKKIPLEIQQTFNLAIVCGGDGTILGTQRQLKVENLPLVGVNLGRLGFLAEFEFSKFEEKIDQLAEKFELRNRLRLRTTLSRNNKVIFEEIALNEAAITQSGISRMVGVNVFINNQFCGNIQGDGLLIATPSGSTAYSLAAGGSLAHPELETILLTPICSHSLTVRPIILPPDRNIKVKLMDDRKAATVVTVDGQVSVEMQVGDELLVSRAPDLLTVKSTTHNFFDALQTKLNWSGHANLPQ